MRSLWPISGSGQDAIQEGRHRIMGEKNDRAVGKTASSVPAGPSQPGEIDRFLGAARRLAPLATGTAGRLVFALDATMSRQPTWDLACSLQGRMFEVAAESGGLAVQLVYFRGLGECRPPAGSASQSA